MSKRKTVPPLYHVGDAVRHVNLRHGAFRVTRVSSANQWRKPTYECEDTTAAGVVLCDIEEDDLLPVPRMQLPPPPPPKSSGKLPTSGPGWLYDAHSGVCLGPASYEQRAMFEKAGRRELDFHNLAGCKRRVQLRER